MDYGFIYSAEAELLGSNRRSLALRCRAGELVRLRPGVYMDSGAWQRLPPWERQAARVRAAASQLSAHRVEVQQSAAVLWGIPVLRCPPEVMLLVAPPSHGRRRGDLHWVQRALLEPPAMLDALRVTSRAQTVLDMAAYLPFESAVPAMDHVLRPDRSRGLAALHKADLECLAQGLPAHVRRTRALTVLDFANPRAESPGESLSRAVMHRTGFPPPELQRVFNTSEGQFRTDFFWDEENVVGEFDGALKYSGRAAGSAIPSGISAANRAGSGPESAHDAWRVVLEEKRRDDAIRASGVRFVRWSWNDVDRSPTDPRSLVQRLIRAGLPRTGRPIRPR